MADGYAPSNDGDIANKKYVDQQVKATIPAYSNSVLFEKNGIFNPATYSLGVGDKIQVICIGGGGSGGGTKTYSGFAAGGSSGDYGCGGAGSDTDETYSYEGNNVTGTGTVYFRGGSGERGNLTKTIVTLDSTNTIPVTIGAGAAATTKSAGATGGTTSFGNYLTATGGRGGGKGYGYYDEENRKWYYSDGVSYKRAGWTVKSYISQDSSGALGKGSGAVYIFY